MNKQQELASLIRDLIEVNQAFASSLKRILTSIERVSGRIAEDRELSTIVSQLSGLHLRACDLAEGQASSGATFVATAAKRKGAGNPAGTTDVHS